MAGRKVSKNQRVTQLGASKAGGGLAGDIKLIIPCNDGKNAYVTTVGGGTPNLSTTSEQFTAAVRGLVEAGQGARVQAELDSLNSTYPGHGWDRVAKRLDAEGVFAG